MKDTITEPTNIVATSNIGRVANFIPSTSSTSSVAPASITDLVQSNAAALAHSRNNVSPSTASSTSDTPRTSSPIASPSTQNSTPPFHKSPSLYVGDLHADIGESTLYEIFQALGPIHSIRVCRDRITRRSLGYAYLNFTAVHDAEHALATMNYFSGPQTMGRPLRLMWNVRDPSLRRMGAGNVFVKGLTRAIDCKTLHDTFTQFGQILSCKIASDDKGESLGYGFVHFESPACAAAAIRRVNGMLLDGEPVHVAPFQRRQEREAAGLVRRTFTNVYVKHLTDSMCTEGALRELFKDYGEITSVYVPLKNDGAPRKYAFVNFASAEEARQAVMEMHGKQLVTAGNGDNVYGASSTVLYVSRAQKRSERATELRRAHARIRRERAEMRQGRNVYVKNLTADVDDERLREHFAAAGSIDSCVVMRDSSGVSRGFGFVCYSTVQEAQKAIEELNGSELGSKMVYVALAQRKEERRASIRAQRAAADVNWTPGAHRTPVPHHFAPPSRMSTQPSPYLFAHAPVFVPSFPNAAIPTAFVLTPPSVQPPPFSHYVPFFAQHSHLQAPLFDPVIPSASSKNAVMQQQAHHAAVRMQMNANGALLHAHHAHVAPHPSFLAYPRPAIPDETHRAPNAPYVLSATPDSTTALSPAVASAPALPPPPAPPTSSAPNRLTIEILMAADASDRITMLGVRLFPLVERRNSEQATKITGMILELDIPDVLHLIDTPHALDERIQDAEMVLQDHAKSIANARSRAVNDNSVVREL